MKIALARTSAVSLIVVLSVYHQHSISLGSVLRESEELAYVLNIVQMTVTALRRRNAAAMDVAMNAPLPKK